MKTIDMKTINRIDISRHYGLSNKKLFSIAELLYKKNRYHESVNTLKNLISSGYTTPEVKFLLARSYDKLSSHLKDIDYDDLAQKTYEELLQLPLKRRIRSRVQMRYNRFINRISEFNVNDYKAVMKSIELSEDEKKSPKAWFMLGSNFNIRKDVDFVITTYKNALELDPSYMLALFRLGYIYQYNKNDELSALHYYVRLVKIDPDSDCNESETTNARCIMDACNQMSKIYYKRNKYRKIVAVLNRAIAIQNEYLPTSALTLVKNLIYLSDISASHLNLKSRLDSYLKKNYYLSFNYLLNRYCKELTVA